MAGLPAGVDAADMKREPSATLESAPAEAPRAAPAFVPAPRASRGRRLLMRLLFWLILLGLAGAALAWWRRADTAVAALLFRTIKVQRGDVTQTVTGSGSLAALTTVEVGSQVSGNILRLHADFNDAVKKGQLLAEIDSSTYEARVTQAENDLLSANVTLEMKQLNARRSLDLLGQKLIAQSDYDQARTDLRQQEATVKNREASLKSARVDLERCTISSPIDGIVISRAVDVGQTVQASFSAPKLFTLAQDLRQMEITANISEADIGTVEAGQPVSFTVDAFSGRAFQGKVRQVRNNTTIANNVVTYPTIITVDNADLKLRPGMTANIVITTSRRANVLRVPNAALRFRPPESAVVLNAPSANSPPDFDQMPPAFQQRLLTQFDKNGDGKLDADERKTMEASMRNRMAAAKSSGGFGPPEGGGGPPPGMGGPGGPGGGPGGGGGGRPSTSSSSSASSTQPVTVYVATTAPNAAGYATGPLQAVRVFVGVSDSTHTEILRGLDEGAVIVSGTVSAQAAAAAKTAGTNNIFSPPRPPGMGKK